jgi:type II secretory pathway pseudopilin PulG
MRWIFTPRRLAEEGGFTIIEASIAMLVVALMFTALSAGLISGLRATRDARLYQQATSIGEEAVEAARDLPYDTLVMTTSDLLSDPRIQSGPPMKFDPDGSGPLLAEPVVASSSGGSIDPHISTETVVNTTFTKSRYVTWVDDAVQGGPVQSYKRMVVIIQWQIGSKTNSYVTSSFIALARRGLPLPKFELAPEAQTVEVEPGNLVVFPHTIRNLGIVDTYDLEVPPTANPRGWVINFYRDEGQLGTFEPVVDSLLLDTNSTGKPDTGSVITDEITYFLAVFALGPTEVPGTVELTLEATSGANDTVSHSSKDTVIVGFAGITLNLHNRPTPPTGDTTAQSEMEMNLNPVSDIELHKYSTDLYGYPRVAPDPPEAGRFIDIKVPDNADETEPSKQYMTNWVYQLPGRTTFNGTVELRLWVARAGFDCGGPAHIRAFLRDKKLATDSGGDTLLATGNAVMVPSGILTCPFQQIALTMALTNVTVQKNRFLELKVTNPNTTGGAVLIAYDTATYRSTLKLPQVSSS